MSKQITVRFGIMLIIIAAIVGGFRASVGYSAVAEAPPVTLPQDAFSLAERIRPAPALVSTSVDGAILTQTFNLRAGWTSIYLEVEPINDSTLVNIGTAEQPIMVPELSTIEAVLAAVSEGGGLSCGDCLESVWTWNIPLTTMDYIVDPAEGLWDAPGWKRYFPEDSLGPDGESRTFLSDLFSLHANTGYLIKLKDGMGAATLTVRGMPVIAHHQWLPDSYNLAGFPIDPEAPSPPTVATFFQDLSAGPSPVTEVRALQADGTWSDPLSAQTTLTYGEAYLVYYRSNDVLNYTAPFDIISTIGESLDFTPGFAGNKQTVSIENLANSTISVQMQLLGQTAPAVALQYDRDPDNDTDPLQTLWPGPASLFLTAGGATVLTFIVPAAAQTSDGEALLAIRAPALGTRWLLPVTAQRGDLAGLWIGEVVINDVSEGRLGGTNVSNGELTIALRPRDLSGLEGAAQFIEMPAGIMASVALTATISLPAPEETLPLQAISATAPYVAGYVFIDNNQNGQRDADEQGLAGVMVTLGSMSRQTADDGLYVFEGLSTGQQTIALAVAPAGYTTDFPVMLPQTTTITSNAVPTSVTVAANGLSALQPEAYRRQVLYSPYTLPQYDADDNRVEPLLNFGMVPIFDASLWTGQCNDRWEKRKDLDAMVNGILLTTISRAALNPGYSVDDLLLGTPSYVLYLEKHGANGADGEGIACGEIVVGAPTRFANGDGSEFRFRVLLRVDENGQTELLPDYVTTEGKRVSSAAFSMMAPLIATGANFGDTSGLLDFSVLIEPNDPLNPYKHKYHPDHDNLDVKFNPIDFNTVAPYLWESYEVRRRLQLELTELPPLPNATATIAVNLDWGGGVWGGLYKEIISGIHKNDITVKGYFIIRHVLSWESLTPQSYDQSGGGGG
ncbi:MAG: hypothetical protein GXP38_09860 [Chloroflexi bacterium]|nr:hypothetical protein [Chloroflexota bacterium]